MTSTNPRELEAQWNELERKHDLQCMWSNVIGNRTIQVECLFVPSAGVTIIVTKHYDHPIPKASYKKPFPKMIAHYAYFPAGGVTWKSMDEALTALKSAVKTPLTEDEAAQINAA